MDVFLAVVAKIGGFSVIGVLIDLAVRKGEKQKINDWLTKWWDRFDSIRWHNFGRREAALAVAILDRTVGSSFWSVQRWKAVLIVSAVVLLISTIWRLVLNFLSEDFRARAFEDLVETYLLPGLWVWLTPTCLFFAVSLSLTRALSVLATRLSKGIASTVTVFVALIMVHIVLLLSWRQIPGMLGISALLIADLTSRPASEVFPQIASQFSVELLHPNSSLADVYKMFTPPSDGPFSFHRFQILIIFRTLLDFVANGLRIGLALVFLVSFVFRPLIQAPISRIWAGALEQDRLTFTTLFTLLGVIVALWQ